MAFTDLIPWRRTSSRISTSESPLLSLQREMNRMFDNFWTSGGTGLAAGFPAEGFGPAFPEIDISETDKHVDLTAEVAGMTDKDIKLHLLDDGETLNIEGEKKTEKESKSEGMYFSERRYGRFRRAVGLPARVDSKQIEATCKDGVLKVHMKKLPDQEQRTRQIPIKSS